MNTRLKRESGMTLIELVMSIVIIAIAVGGVLGLLAQTSGHSADAMIISQAVSIGEAYAEEIGLQSFDDPDGSDGGEGCRRTRRGAGRRVPPPFAKDPEECSYSSTAL